MPVEKGTPCGRYRYPGRSTFQMLADDIATGIGLLPHREAWARGAPSLDDLRVRPGLGADPFEKVDDQGVNGIRHRHLRTSSAITLPPPWADGNRKP